MTGQTPDDLDEQRREVVIETADAESTRALGGRLAVLLRAGDLVMLSGDLGAGKTTLAQGVGAAMGVRGRVSSPTFIIARVHPALADGPDLIHVDAYRLSSLEEVDALDLDSSMDDSVTLVEWGQDKVEALSADRLEITIARPRGGLVGGRAEAPGESSGAGSGSADSADSAGSAGSDVTDLTEADDSRRSVRSVTVTAVGPRWTGVDLTRLQV
ncbi:tRNA (adenosine(37)-N6)-threonylcarbamoyltransferase complex ATPase subunit type 1 TsaE [Actinomyces massiliensis]|jgi:hydrolase, P-loop family|uniref:tRNA (adenosine(37)-N6)-threonylcarbamoyltransferase complex ATPase subunit type 1 TsaE n=1 Tax=Actinomyces massiliensis TaxID=461393 RepID=UPI00235227C8|nr:tRNA (adenosine(37)-N6)-threonylcarbamoyltransferase complex ATPase subunit type 1 TsaE [Actinomyces massiliensis]